MASNIYINEVTASTTLTNSLDLSMLKNIKLYNLSESVAIKVAFDAATNVATETLNIPTKESGIQAVPVELPVNAKGGTLYYSTASSTATLQVVGMRV